MNIPSQPPSNRTEKPTNSRESTTMKKRYIVLGAGMTGLLTVGCTEGILGTLLAQFFLLFLGATPAPSFGQTGEVEFNLVAQTGGDAVEGTDDAVEGDTAGETPDVDYVINVFKPAGTTATIEEIATKPAEEVGTFSILLDSSGSMEGTYTSGVCDTCPHDASRLRVQASQQLSKEVLRKLPESRMGIFDFGPGATEGFSTTRVLTPYTSDVTELHKGAESTVSDGGTFIYDSLCEILDYMDGDIQEHFQTKPITKAIVLVSDGQDTESTRCSLGDVIAKAQSLEIPVHVIGLGPASEDFQELFNTAEKNDDLLSDLRRLANETGGFYASVTSDRDIVELAEVIAVGLAGGYTTTTVVLDPIPPSGTEVTGEICPVEPVTLDKAGECEPWSFVAP